MNNSDVFRSVNAIKEYLEKSSNVWNQYGTDPATGSIAAIELSSFPRPESIATAFSQGNLFIEAAADYTWAITKTLTAPVETIAPWACARGVLEAAALATWLADTQINAYQRVQRSLALRYEGLQEQIQLLRISKRISEAQTSLSRIDEIEEIAVSLGIPKVFDKKGRKACWRGDEDAYYYSNYFGYAQ